MPTPGCVPRLARVYAKPEVRLFHELRQGNLTDSYHSRYARDTKQLEDLKALDVLKPLLLDLFADDSLKGGISPQEPRAEPSFTANFVNGGSNSFSLDLAAAVRTWSLLIALCSRWPAQT